MKNKCPNLQVAFCTHFLTEEPSFEIQRRDFLAGVSELLRSFVQTDTLPNKVLIEYLLYGDKSLSDDVDRSILGLILEFIHRTGRQEVTSFLSSGLEHRLLSPLYVNVLSFQLLVTCEQLRVVYVLPLSFKSLRVVLCSCFLFCVAIRKTLFFVPNCVVLVVGYCIL